MDIIHQIAELPELRMCETLAVIDLPTLRRFNDYYGLDDDPDSGDLIPFSAHEIVASRLNPDPRRPRMARQLMTQDDKCSLMAERAGAGRAIRNARDPRVEDPKFDGMGILTIWGAGAEPRRIGVVGLRAA